MPMQSVFVPIYRILVSVVVSDERRRKTVLIAPMIRPSSVTSSTADIRETL